MCFTFIFLDLFQKSFVKTLSSSLTLIDIYKKKRNKQFNIKKTIFSNFRISMSDQESINILNSLIPPPIGALSLSDETDSKQTKNTTMNGHKITSTPMQDKIPLIQTNGSENHLEETEAPPRGCPFFLGSKPDKANNMNKKFPDLSFQTSISIASEPILYHDYLQLDKILNAQFPVSKKFGNMAHDEHLFIVIHQGKYEEYIIFF